MKKIKKYAALLVAALCLVTNLTGCTQVFEETVTSIVQWDFEFSYLGKFNKTYLEMCDMTYEEANELYLEHLENEAEYFVNYWGIVDSSYGESYQDLNEEFRSSVVMLINEIFSHAQFEVQSAVIQSDGSYAVKVSVSPIDVLEKANNAFDTFEPLNAFFEKYTDEVVEAMSDTEYWAYTHEYGNLILYLVHEQMDSLDYMNTKTPIIQVALTDEGWEINEDDLVTFDSYVVYYP